MKTIVYQSFRTRDVPEWISTCMHSVRRWAESNNFDYAFIDDRLFQYAPRWYREKVRDQIHLVSDLARLVLAGEFMANGYEKTIWIDADVIIFSPEKFTLDLTEEYAFCHEVWLKPVSRDKLGYSRNVNNAVMLLTKGSSLLEFYIHACEEIVKHNTKILHNSVGTRFLTSLNAHFPIAGIRNVGLFSPLMMHAIDKNIGDIISFYMRAFGHEAYAANLCTTFRNTNCYGVHLTDENYGSVISKLVQTNGELINRYRAKD